MKFRKKPIVVEAWQLPLSDGAAQALDTNPNIRFTREDGWRIVSVPR